MPELTNALRESLKQVTHLNIKVRRYVRVADLVRQLESFAEERITETAFWRWGSEMILHFSNSNATFANVDRSLFDVSFKRAKTSQI